MEITKVIIPIAGLGTRFLPLSKVMPKELWPLVNIPTIHHVVQEAKASGIKQLVFVISPEKRVVLDYFKGNPKTEKILKKRKKEQELKQLQELDALFQDISFTSVLQKRPLGDGHAILQAEGKVGNESCAVLFADDIVDSKTPCLMQLAQVFKTCQKPIVALYRLPKERLPFYGIVGVEKIANRLYKIKGIVEKPTQDSAPSDLAIVGKYILTPEVFDYLNKAKPSERGEIILADTFDKMIKDGKIIYGYEFEGKWLECGNKLGWLESNFYLSLKDPEFGPQLKKFLNNEKLI